MDNLLRYARYKRRVRRTEQVTLLTNGSEAFPQMLDAIKNAKHFINIGFYIWRGDTVGWAFADLLGQKSREGVKVRAIYDALGCIDVDPLVFDTMQVQGVEIHQYRPLAPWRPRWGLFGRWHRKLLVVDNAHGFCGGINLADKYAVSKPGQVGWRDAMVHLQGVTVNDLNRLFMNTWNHVNNVAEPQKPLPTKQPSTPPGKTLAAIESSSRLQWRIRASYLHAIRQAKRTISISNAYFVPGARIRSALYRAVKRGVEVKVIVPHVNDIRLVGWATQHLYRRLLKRGVRIFEWKGSMLHAKTAVIDGLWSTVGSSNLDHLSLRRNLEVNAVVLDPHFGKDMKATFETDLLNCSEVTVESLKKRSWWVRLRSWLVYQLRAIL